MYFTIIIFLIGIALGALVVYPFAYALLVVFNRIEVPVEIGGEWVNLFSQARTWWLFIGVLIPLAIWVFYNSRRPKKRTGLF